MCAKVWAVVLAGGVGSRMGAGSVPKQFMPVRGKPIVCHTLERFEECPAVDGVVVPCLAGWGEALGDMVRACGLRKVLKIVPGGGDRQASIRIGLAALPSRGPEDVVLIHDAVRPLVRRETILANIGAAREWGAAVTVRESPEAVVVAPGERACLGDFADRSRTGVVTAPQGFQVREILEAYEAVERMPEPEAALLDAAMVYARAKGEVRLVREPPGNVKITTREDLRYFEACLGGGECGGAARRARRWPGGWKWI